MEADGALRSTGAAAVAEGAVNVSGWWLGTAPGTGGRQFAHAPYLAAASARGISMALDRREVHTARCYLEPVRVT